MYYVCGLWLQLHLGAVRCCSDVATPSVAAHSPAADVSSAAVCISATRRLTLSTSMCMPDPISLQHHHGARLSTHLST